MRDIVIVQVSFQDLQIIDTQTNLRSRERFVNHDDDEGIEIDVTFSTDDDGEDEYEDFSRGGILALTNRQETDRRNSQGAHASTRNQAVTPKPRPAVSPATVLAASPTVAGSASLKANSTSTTVSSDASVSSGSSTNATNFAEIQEGEEKKFTGAFSWWMVPLIILGVALLLTLLAFLVYKVRKNDQEAAKGPTQTPKPQQPKEQPQEQKDTQQPIKDLGANLTKVAATPTEDIEKAINTEIQNQLKEKVEKIVV